MIMMVSELKMPKVKFVDIAATIMLVFVFAFFDYSKLSVLAQVIFVVAAIIEALIKKKQVPMLYVTWLFTFSLWSLLSATWALNTSSLVSCFISIIQVAILGTSIVFYVDCERRIKFFINSMIFSASLLCIRFFVAVPMSIWGNGERLKDIITFSSNIAPMMLCFVSLIIFSMCLKRRNITYYAFIATFIFVAILYGTRKVIIIIVLGVGIQMLLSASKPIKLLKNILVCCVTTLIGYYMVMNVQLLYGAIGYRIEGMISAINGSSGDGSSIARLAFIECAKDVFMSYPLLGIGLDGFRYVNVYEPTYAHNNYYELLCDLGIVGLLLYYRFHAQILYKIIRTRRFDRRLNLVLAIIISYLCIDYFNVSYSEELAHTMLAFVYAIFRVSMTNLVFSEK